MLNEQSPHYLELMQTEGVQIVKSHWTKTVATLEHLMNLMNMMYFYQKLQLQFHEQARGGLRRPSIMMLEKLMNRCFKLYAMIDDFMKIFKLIEVKKVSEIV